MRKLLRQSPSKDRAIDISLQYIAMDWVRPCAGCLLAHILYENGQVEALTGTQSRGCPARAPIAERPDEETLRLWLSVLSVGHAQQPALWLDVEQRRSG
jgi:hypothetical protein